MNIIHIFDLRLTMKRLLIFLTFLAAVAHTAIADHVVGSDILYKCLGNGKYEITFKFYRDCNGCNVAGNGGGGTGAQCGHPVINITGANGSCNGVGKGNVTMTPIGFVDITQLCGTTKSRCDRGSFPYGIEEHTYKGIVDFSTLISQGCCKFKISTTIYVRSTTITTGAANQGFYTDATIDACNNLCNNSPIYTSKPVAIICLGQDFVFNNGALDTLDVGDSLSYALAPAYQGASSQVSYSGQFSPQRPMTFLGFPNTGFTQPGGFRLDSLTGDLTFRPAKKDETGLIVIEVTEWRKINGTMTEIGRTRRDMQVIVVSCPDNKIPVIYPPFRTNACANQTVCMDIETFDPDSTRDTVKISWNAGIPGAKFTHNNGKARFASGTVCWTPNTSHVSNIPYTFTIQAKDDACPLNGVAIRAFSIYVHETPEATRTYTKLACGNVWIKSQAKKNYVGGLQAKWVVKDSNGKAYNSWSTLADDTIQMRPGKNFVTLTLNTTIPCISTYIDTVIIDPYVQVTLPPDTLICEGSQTIFTAAIKNGKPAYHFSWNASTTDTLPTFPFALQKDTSFYVTVNDVEGCVHSDTVNITYGKKPLIHLDTGQRICFYNTIQLDAGNDTFPSTYKYLWNTSDTSRKITVKDSNSYIARVTDSLGCSNRDTFRLYVNQVPVSAGPNQKICFADTATLIATGAQTYNWYLVPGTTPIGNKDTLKVPLTTPQSFAVYAQLTKGGVTCEHYDTVDVAINQLPTINFATIKEKCEKSNPFYLINDGILPPTLTNGNWTCVDDPDWVQGNFFIVDSVRVTPPAFTKLITLRYTVSDINGCKKSSNTTFSVIRLPEIVLKDTSVCADKGKVDLKQLVLPPTSTAPGNWQWSSTTNEANTAIESNGKNALFNLSKVTQGQSYPLCLKTVNTYNCENTNCLTITVREVPIVDAGFVAPVCENDTIFRLNQASPPGGVWQSTSTGFVNNTWFNPALVSAGQTYPLTYTYDIPGNFCPVTDSLFITIKPKPIITLTPPANVCSDTGTINLMDLVNPKGGIWSGIGVATNGSFNATNNSGTTTIKYDYQGLNFCKNNITSSFSVQTTPKVSLNQPGPACIGFPFNLSSQYTDAGGVNWTTAGSGNFTTPSLPNTDYNASTGDLAAGNVKVFVTTTGNGICKPATQSVTINIYPNPSASISYTPDAGCEPLPVSFTSITDLPNNATYEWNFGNPSNTTSTLQNPLYTYEENGTYTVNLKVISEYGCDNDASPVVVTVHPVPVANIAADYWLTTVLQTAIQFSNISTIDNPGSIDTLLWSFGDVNNTTSTMPNPTFEYPPDSATYLVSLRVASNKGCVAQTSRPLKVLPQLTAFIPNAFSPEGSGMIENERFWVTANSFTSFSIKIYTRWGETVYTSNNIKEGWDGNYKGIPAQQDVYVYLVNFTGQDGKDYAYKGTLTLLR